MKKSLLFLFLYVAITGCRPSISPDQLYGKWNYTRLENPNANPPFATPAVKLQYNHPSIEFIQQNQLIMKWKDTVLSQGKFKTQGHNIVYTEMLPDGKTRTFPFVVTKLTDKEITFETSGDEGTSVTAVREGR
jgi:hypothetical protein